MRFARPDLLWLLLLLPVLAGGLLAAGLTALTHRFGSATIRILLLS